MEKTEIVLEQQPVSPVYREGYREERKIQAHPLIWRIVGASLLCGGTFFCGGATVLRVLHPLGLACVCACMGKGTLFFVAAAAMAAGNAAAGIHSMKYMGALLLLALLEMIGQKTAKRKDAMAHAVKGAAAMAVAGVVFAIAMDSSFFYLSIALAESVLVLCFSILLEKAMEWLSQGGGRTYDTQRLSLTLFLGCALGGMSALWTLPIWLLPMLLTMFLLPASFCWGSSSAAAAGVAVSAVLWLCADADWALFGMAAVGGLLAGLMQQQGKLLAATVYFSASSMMLMAAGAEKETLFRLCGIAAGVVFFLLLPQKTMHRIFGGGEDMPKDGLQRTKEVTKEKLEQFASAFDALAQVFPKEDMREKKEEIPALVDAIASKVCSNCAMAHCCWEEEIYRTYSMTFQALTACEAGTFAQEKLPPYFLQTCPHTAEYAEAIQAVYSNYCRDRLWLRRMSECRALVGRQLYAVGDILRELSETLSEEYTFSDRLREELITVCEKERIPLRQLTVLQQKKTERVEIHMVLKDCGGKDLCRGRLQTLLRKTLGRAVCLLEETPCLQDKSGYCRLTFVEEARFRLSTAIAAMPQKAGAPSGDTATVWTDGKGSALMALSDGMGTGEAARKQSLAAIELLENFCAAGFSKEVAVQLINSALLLGKTEEIYATLDICSVDLYSARGEFIKLGASAAYIWRSGRVIRLQTASLPAGILEKVEIVKNEIPLKDGDMILLLTDGVTDALGGEADTAAWLKEKLERTPMRNPQDVADCVLEGAKAAAGEERKDDMTVLAGRFWEKWSA